MIDVAFPVDCVEGIIMAWEWSHSAEAYEAVRLNIGDLSRDDLREIYAEWRADVPHDDEREYCYDDYFDEEIYNKTLRETVENKIHDESLVGTIYDYAQDQAVCDNGGFEAWVCPYGCHTVSFDRDSEKDR